MSASARPPAATAGGLRTRRPSGPRNTCAFRPGIHPLVRTFFDLLDHDWTSQAAVAERVGSRIGTISDWKRRRNPGLVLFDDALRAVGYRLAIVGLDDDELEQARNTPAQLIRHRLKTIDAYLGRLVREHGTPADRVVYATHVRGLEDIAEILEAPPLPRALRRAS